MPHSAAQGRAFAGGLVPVAWNVIVTPLPVYPGTYPRAGCSF